MSTIEPAASVNGEGFRSMPRAGDPQRRSVRRIASPRWPALPVPRIVMRDQLQRSGRSAPSRSAVFKYCSLRRLSRAETFGINHDRWLLQRRSLPNFRDNPIRSWKVGTFTRHRPQKLGLKAMHNED